MLSLSVRRRTRQAHHKSERDTGSVRVASGHFALALTTDPHIEELNPLALGTPRLAAAARAAFLLFTISSTPI